MDGFQGFDYAEQRAREASFESGDMVPTGNDAAYDAEFYMGKVPNFTGTDYTEVPHLRLRLAGDNNRVYDQPIVMESAPNRPSDPERFPRQWAAFQRGEALGTSGTLMVDWSGAEPGDVRRLEMQGVKTVEQLAAIGDHQLTALGMGARALREQARTFVQGALNVASSETAEEVAKLKGIVEGLLEIMTPEQKEALADKARAAKAKPRQRAAA